VLVGHGRHFKQGIAYGSPQWNIYIEMILIRYTDFLKLCTHATQKLTDGISDSFVEAPNKIIDIQWRLERRVD